jgi:hypothetical protein
VYLLDPALTLRIGAARTHGNDRRTGRHLMTTMHDRYRGGLLGGAVGDALGAGIESLCPWP